MRPIPIPLLDDNYAWLIPVGDDGAIVVDPSEAQGVQKVLDGLRRKLLGLLITHHHQDHIGGVKNLLHGSLNPIPVVASSDDMASSRVAGANVVAVEGQPLVLAGQSFAVLETPGHTRGAVAYYWVQGRSVFTGDTLFLGGCGRLFEGDAATMHASLTKLQSLPDETWVCCGHEYTEKNLCFAASILPEDEAIKKRLHAVQALRAEGAVTVPEMLHIEKRTNLFLRAHDPLLQQELKTEDAKSTFAKLRQLKDIY